MKLPFVGPSYALNNRKASVQRSVNLFLSPVETPSKAAFILKSVPGLTVFAAMGAEVRGIFEADDRCFVVAGSVLYELSSAGVATNLGSLASDTGPVDAAWGTTQLVIVDGPNGYVLTLETNALVQITSDAWLGSDRVSYIDGFFVFVDPNTQRHYLSAIDDATDLGALDFASAESAPDDIVAHIVVQRQVIFFGKTTTEFWSPQGGTYFLARDSGTIMQLGCMATHSAQLVDNGAMWLGRDLHGAGIVYRLAGLQPQRISTIAVEEALAESTDLTQARAYVYQYQGQTFYCLNAPGLTSTWCYELATGSWHERCDVDEVGNFEAHRVVCHAYALGKHLVGDVAGNVYELDPAANTFDGDTLKRSRISPNDVTPLRDRQFFNEFTLDCTTGEAALGVTATVELSWSDDGGYTWSNKVPQSMGLTGEYFPRVTWFRLGTARDRVWRVDFTDNAPFSIISAETR
jgi:hypothetical protein